MIRPPLSIAQVLPEYLSTAQLAALLGTTRDALEQQRRRGKGPQFIRVSPRCIRYRRSDVEAFLSARVERPGRVDVACVAGEGAQ